MADRHAARCGDRGSASGRLGRRIGVRHRSPIIQPVARYDDELWELVPEDPGPPPAHVLDFVKQLAPAERALDLGVGDGRVATAISATRLIGADVSQVALDRARTRLPDAELVLIEPDEPLPFADNEFDLVTCIETLEHVRDVQLALSEIRRVLRPGGRLALTTPAASRWRVLLRGMESPFSPHIRAFSRRSLRTTLEAMGFHVIELDMSHATLVALAVR
jgi:ubiquinone/menaquinone biosynthesis C-methylase UbiE